MEQLERRPRAAPRARAPRLLEAALEGGVLLNVLPVLAQGGRALGLVVVVAVVVG